MYEVDSETLKEYKHMYIHKANSNNLAWSIL